MTRFLPQLAPGLVLLAALGCGGSRPPTARPASAPPAPINNPVNLTFDAVPLYRQAGLLARGLPMPFVARIGFMATQTPDTTHAVIAVSLANNALSFTRESDTRFRASYSASVSIRRGTETVAEAGTTEEVIVGAFRETTRSDETLVFQQVIDVPPGEYEVTVTLRDEGSQRNASEQGRLSVPRFDEGTVTSPLPVHEATPRTSRDVLPRLIVNPRATAVFGRDSAIAMYVERYDATASPVRLEVRNERGRVLWSNEIDFPTGGTDLTGRVIEVPVSRIGIGVAEIALVREGSASSAASGVFVSFGDELPVASFENMLTYLRYFAAPHRLDALRAAPEEQRPTEWARFVRETDEQDNTPQHEALRDYFARLVRANARYGDATSVGWLSDRGRVYITLGDPDQIIEPAAQNFNRVRQQVWEYRELNAQIVFYDETGTGRWRMTPASNTRFEAEFRRRLR